MSTIFDSIRSIQERIDNALAQSGRPAGSARLLAVTKTFDAATVQQAYDAGLRCFGENKVQEMLGKRAVLPQDIQWHLIGHLQQNKAKAAAANASWIHSVDSSALLQRINRLSVGLPKAPKVLIQVNISGEASKSGAAPDAVESIFSDNLQGPCPLCGLMTIPPAEASELELHDLFSKLRALRDSLEGHLGIALPELSMGMSHDFEIAIAEGATMVRVGSAIFGHRDYSIKS